MSKQISFLLCLALCGCDEHQTKPKLQGGRIQFKEYNYTLDLSLSIVAVDSIEFLINHRTGYMVRITNGGDK
jgi:hypothetical protein